MGLPAAPKRLEVYKNRVTETTARIKFRDHATNELGFRIYNNDILLKTIDAQEGMGKIRHELENLTSGTTYNITIKAFNNIGESEASNRLLFATNIGQEKESQFLYQNLNIDIEENYISVKNPSNGQILLESDRISFNNNHQNNNLNITHSIARRIGGFDIAFTIHNPTNTKETFNCDLTVPNINFGTNNNLHLLNSTTYLIPIERNIMTGEQVFMNESGLSYPVSYSPVTVAHNNTFAVGVSLHTIYPRDNIALKQYIKHKNNGKWDYIFNTTQGKNGVGNENREDNELNPGESIYLTMSVRFAENKNWLFTLAPYQYLSQKTPPKPLFQKDE